MAITSTMEPFEAQLWPQGDARDPLGTWACRVAVIGDASGGTIKVTVSVPQARRSAYVYAHYSAQLTQFGAAAVAQANVKVRILQNWPNSDAQAGVNAYSTAKFVNWTGSSTLTDPTGMPTGISNIVPWIAEIERFLLCYDPRQGVAGPLDILELEILQNTDLVTYAFEAMGYYWDRSAMNAPGGPRHPGAN